MTQSTETRLNRIESKLTRLMLGLGMDTEGNPAVGSLVIDKKLTDELLETLDSYLLMIDNQGTITSDEADEKFSQVEALYNKLVDIRGGRWPIN